MIRQKEVHLLLLKKFVLFYVIIHGNELYIWSCER